MCARTRWWIPISHGGLLPCWASVLFVLALPAAGQFPDVLSESECPGCAAFAPARFDGVWSSALTAGGQPGWALADFYCFAACTTDGRMEAERLLAGSEFAHRSALELYGQAVAANVDAVETLTAGPSSLAGELPGFSCDPLGFAAQIVSPLPLEIQVGEDRVVLRYEEFAAERTIPLGGPAAQHHGHRSTLGLSKGRFEDGVLVIETSGVSAGRLSDWLGGFAHRDALRAIERYSVSADGRWLELELTLVDPATFAEPLVVTKRWVRAQGARIMRHGCDVMAAGLRGVFAEYLDPRIVETARRRAARP